MIGEWMAYATVVATSAACVAAAAEPWLRARRLPARWAWVAVFGASVLAPLAVGMRPRPESARAGQQAGALVQSERAGVEPAASGRDRWLAIAWAGGSLLVAGALLVGLAQLARARRRAVRGTLAGRLVAITADFGPGAAPFGEPRILVPRWVQELTPEAIGLLLTHEDEHVRAGDARLLLGATLVAAVLPWNVALWWSLKRLRTAIELDCDARVLRQEPCVSAYARLLLDVAGRGRSPAAPALLAFADSTSQLRTRIDAMTIGRSLTLGGRVTTVALALAALVVACETRRPEPVAPVTALIPDLAGGAGVPIVIVRTADGRQLFVGRLAKAGRDQLAGVPPQEIESVEVIKGRAASPDYVKGGLVVISLKPDASWRPSGEPSVIRQEEP